MRAVKRTVKTLGAWYLRYLSEQVTSLGHATVRLGETLVERTDGLERSAAATASEVAALRARIERIERFAGPRGPSCSRCQSMRIDQFVPGFAKHDAIGNHSLRARAALRAAGFDSDIYGEVIDSRVASEARPYHEAPPVQAGTLALYHASTHSDMADWLAARSAAGQVMLSDYHNITPSEYFARWEPQAGAQHGPGAPGAGGAGTVHRDGDG